MSMYSNRLQPALQNLLQHVVRFFHPRSSYTTTHISADVQRITLNASCMTISCGKPNNSMYSATSLAYSVLSWNPSIILFSAQIHNTVCITTCAHFCSIINCCLTRKSIRSLWTGRSLLLLDVHIFPVQGSTLQLLQRLTVKSTQRSQRRCCFARLA